MSTRLAAELVLLGAIWGASFLFMRVATPAFGPLATSLLRLAIGAAVLLPLLPWLCRRDPAGPPWRSMWQHRTSLLVLGAANSALPFTLFAYATLSLPAGFTSILNATAPLWGGVIGWLWLGDKPAATRALGLLVGFAGVLVLAAERLLSAPASAVWQADLLGIAAGVLAGGLYGWSAHFARRRLSTLPSPAVAAGSQAAAALLLTPFALWTWPQHAPTASAWLAVLALGLLCTGGAYLLYFHLIGALGAVGATTVAYLIPMFGVLWGTTLLAEPVTPGLLVGGGIILLGTALATGALPRAR